MVRLPCHRHKALWCPWIPCFCCGGVVPLDSFHLPVWFLSRIFPFNPLTDPSETYRGYFVIFGVMLLNTIVALIVDSFQTQRRQKREDHINLGKWLWVKTNGIPFGVGEFTTHFRTYFSGWIGMFWGYGLLTHGQMRSCRSFLSPL